MRYVHKLAELFVAILFVAIVIVGALQVFNRFVLNASLSWSEEFQKFAFIWLVFITIPIAYRRSEHLRVETFFDMLPTGLRSTLRWLIEFFWFGLGVSLVVFTSQLMRVTKYQLSPGLGLSMSVIYAGVALGGFYLVLCVSANVVARVRAKWGESWR